ncbi:hypothetical protein O1611_g6167 [Lasiodiplodia mahajangana]|uniref:Uncharacterized protein n=1 Tax=Lasiodiplodia mahajangana TaxID=1108764 RepID=A0ACC2JJC5_9PEZI|nr:hypothetical protein O1611_g6167 [Lasiodiplodia mahajangana]
MGGIDEKGRKPSDIQLGDVHDLQDLTVLGYKPELQRNRSMFTLLFQSLAIAAIPYGFGSPLISAILASPRYRTVLSFITGWSWLIGNWTITLSVNFGFASLVAATVNLFQPDFVVEPWQLLLIFYALCFLTFFVVAFGNKILPLVDTICAIFTAISILVTLITLSVKAEAGRHSPSYTLGHYNPTLSGWGNFSFFIGILPAAYTFSAIGMISSMAEECDKPTTKLPNALSLCVPIGGIAGLFFAPVGQALPYIFGRVTGSPGGGLALTLLVFIITFFCSVSITVAASRCTWAFARDNAIPLASLWAKIDERHGTPIWALVLTTVVQLLLGLINLGSSSAFLAFVSVGVISLAVSYGIPIAISLTYRRKEVQGAHWKMPSAVGFVVNVIAVAWIVFELVLFSLPTVLPVTAVSMNYAIVVFVGFMALSAVWYGVYARKVYRGPPESDGLTIDS